MTMTTRHEAPDRTTRSAPPSSWRTCAAASGPPRPSTGSPSLWRRASWWRCSDRRAAARPPPCGSWPGSRPSTRVGSCVDGVDQTADPGPAARHGHGLPELQPVPQHDGPGQRGLRAPHAQGGDDRPPQAGARAARAGRASRARRTSTPTRCRAASSSGWPWPAPWPSSPGCCCSTSRCPPSTPRSGCSCVSRSASCRRGSKITTLFVTHDQEEALSMADRVCVMRAGRIEQVATPAELYAAPATPFVAEFVGTMNRIPGRHRRRPGVAARHHGGRPHAGRATGRPQRASGTPVDVLVRPEGLQVTAQAGRPRHRHDHDLPGLGHPAGRPAR